MTARQQPVVPAPPPDLARLQHVTCTYGGAPSLVDVDLGIDGRCVRRRGRSVRGRQDDAAAGAARHGPAGRRHGRPSTRPARRLRPPGRHRELVVPGDGRRVRAHGPRPRASPAVAQRGRAGRGGGGARAPRHRRAGRPPHPRPVGRPAAAGVHRPRPARPARSCCCSTNRRRASTCAPATTCSTSSGTCTTTGWRSCSPPTTSTASPPTCPPSCACGREIIGIGTPAEVLTARQPRAHLRRADGDHRARRDADRDRSLPRARRRAVATDGRVTRVRAAPPLRVRVLPQRRARRHDRRGAVRARRRVRRAQGDELHRSRTLARHLRRVRRERPARRQLRARCRRVGRRLGADDHRRHPAPHHRR